MKISILVISLLMFNAVWSQNEMSITAAEKKELVETVKRQLERYYVLPDKGKEMGQYLVQRFNAKAYNGISEYRAFVDTIASDIGKVHMDPHMGLFFDPEYVQHIKDEKLKTARTPGRLEEERSYYRKKNYGFQRVALLPGNIGYMAVSQFAKVTEESKTVIASAFEFIAYSEAVIIDVRSNTGGEPKMVHELLSYFFDQPVLASITYDREMDRTSKNYVLQTVKGKKVPGKKLYILTSGNTFSAGEAFAYFMKNLKRATVIGEVTAGAAHGQKPFIVNDKVVIHLPFERGVDALTKTDWEGVGVQPDVVVKADKALAKAQEMILETALDTAKDAGERFASQWALVAVKAALVPVVLSDALKNEYAGLYGTRNIFIEDGQLFFQRGNGPKRKLTALTEETFELDGVDDYRIRFVRNPDGKVDKMVGSNNYNVTKEFLRETKTNRGQ
jgi:hypothetical protein